MGNHDAAIGEDGNAHVEVLRITVLVVCPAALVALGVLVPFVDGHAAIDVDVHGVLSTGRHRYIAGSPADPLVGIRGQTGIGPLADESPVSDVGIAVVFEDSYACCLVVILSPSGHHPGHAADRRADGGKRLIPVPLPVCPLAAIGKVCRVVHVKVYI